MRFPDRSPILGLLRRSARARYSGIRTFDETDGLDHS
jgi:hypothetical protein